MESPAKANDEEDTNVSQLKRIIIYSSSTGQHLEAKKKRSETKKRRLNSLGRVRIEPKLYDEPLVSGRSRKDQVYRNLKPDAPAVERAAEFQAYLEADFPSLIKTMVPSHISSGFFLKLPKKFCRSYMPRHDATIILVDEHDEEYITSYLAMRFAISGGWRRFARAHNLIVDDSVVFHLVRPHKFKVYIVRANRFSEVDGAVALLNLDPRPRQMDFCKSKVHAETKRLKPLSVRNGHDTLKVDNQMRLFCKSGLLLDQSEDNSEDISSIISEGIVNSEHITEFSEVKQTDNFSILVNGLTVELSGHLRSKYYELCRSQKSYLHDSLLKTINKRLAAEMIAETVNIAYSIGSDNPLASQTDYLSWEKTLKAFELLGMKVEFLRIQLKQMRSLAFDLNEAVESHSA